MRLIVDRCPCGELIITTVARRATGRGYYCDLKCFYEYRPYRLPETYTVQRANSTSYKPGNVPWNKGRKKTTA